jgi:hypothetical protein
MVIPRGENILRIVNMSVIDLIIEELNEGGSVNLRVSEML